MPWKPMVKVVKDEKWYGNALVFATKEEAEDSAKELGSRWMAVLETRADETNDKVNYKFKDGQNIRLVDDEQQG